MHQRWCRLADHAGFAILCLSVWPAVTISFLLALRHIARADVGMLRLSLRTAISAPERDNAEKLNPSYDPRSAALRRRYQLVALQSVLFLGALNSASELTMAVFAMGQAVAGIIATIAVFNGSSIALTTAATSVVYYVDDAVVLPLGGVLLLRTIVGLRSIPESVGQPSLRSADSVRSPGPPVEVSLAEMLRTPRSRSSMPPPASLSQTSLPEFQTELKGSEIGVAK